MTTSSSIWLSVGRVMSQRETETVCKKKDFHYSCWWIVVSWCICFLFSCSQSQRMCGAEVCNPTAENKSTHTKQRTKEWSRLHIDILARLKLKDHTNQPRILSYFQLFWYQPFHISANCWILQEFQQFLPSIQRNIVSRRPQWLK